MPDSGNRALYNENIGPGFLRDLSKLRRALRNGADRCQRAAVFNLSHARSDQILLDGFLINSL